MVTTMTQTSMDLMTKHEPRQPERIFHTWEKWECYPAGFHENSWPVTKWDNDDLRDLYAEFLGNDLLFRAALERVLEEWPMSCEHNLTNQNMNRIAWLGQAAACIAFRVPSVYRGGFYRLSEEHQARANETALEYLNKWLTANGGDALTMEQAKSKTEANLY